MRILKFIYTAVLTSEVADVRYEKDCLQRSSTSEETGSEEPPAEIKQLLHISRKSGLQ